MRSFAIPIKLETPPIVLVICQVKFSPLPKINSFIEDIQSALRKEGFPRFEETQITDINLTNKEPKIISNKRWDFKNEDLSTGIFLGNNFITLQTTQYESFEASFSKNLSLTLSILLENSDISLSLVERIGLRYINLIPISNGKAESFLNQKLLGIDPASLDLADYLTKFELVGSNNQSKLVLRLQKAVKGQFLPPDIDSLDLKFETVQKLSTSNPCYILDIDHYLQDSFVYEKDKIFEIVQKNLHSKIEKAFLEVVTDEALSSWGCMNV